MLNSVKQLPTIRPSQSRVCLRHIISGFGIYGAAVVPDSGVGCIVYTMRVMMMMDLYLALG